MKRTIALAVCLLATLMAILSARPSSGEISIMLNFEAGNSEYPDFDSDCSGLTSLFEAAVDRYKDIIMDTHPLLINYWYEDLAGGYAGMHSGAVYGTSSPVRETQCNIRIDTRMDLGGDFREWFIDESPELDNEFTMTRTLYRDLDSAAQAAFNGSPPDVFEVGYIGGASTQDAIDGLDMLSTIMHEIGHAVGVGNSMEAIIETGDGDYDINPVFVGGATMAVNHAAGGNTAHLAGNFPMMRPPYTYGQRRLPSNSDLFAMAQVQQYTYVNLAHREFLGGTDLYDGDNWIGGYPPNLTVNGYVRPNNGVTPYALTTGNIAFRNLSILEGSAVTISPGDTLDVFEETLIDGVDSTGMSRIRVQTGGIFNTEDLSLFGNVSGNNALVMLGGIVNVTGEAYVYNTGSITGHGTLSVTDNLSNDGLIAADGGLLTLTTPSSSTVWDLDYGTGQIEAIDGDIDIQGKCYDFAGTMTIGAGRRIFISSEWTLDPFGQVYLNGAPGNPAQLLLPDGVIAGRVVVDGEAEISDSVLFLGADVPDGAADIRMPDAGDMLTLSGLHTFRSGAFWGDGTLKQAGDFTIEGGPGLNIGVATYDWGNSVPGQSNDTVVDGTTFIVNSSSTGTPDNEYRGYIELRNGTLTVNTTTGWTLPDAESIHGQPDLPGGILHLSNRKGGDPPAIEGQQLTVAGEVWATGGLGVISAPFVTTPTAIVSPGPGAEIELRGATTWNGGSIYGYGGIRQIADATVVGNTIIEPTFYDWDGNDNTPSQTTINPNTTLTIDVQSIENGGDDSFDGVVNVNGGWLILNGLTSWSLAAGARINMDGSGPVALLAGAPVTVFGQVDVVGLMNEFQSEVTFETTATVTVPQADSRLNLNGNTNYRGGQYTGAGWINQSADAIVREPTTIDVGTFDMDGLAESSTISLQDSLTLNVDQVDADNVFDGTIDVAVDGVTLSVNTSSRWVMNGLLHFAPPPGGTLHVAGDPMEHSGVVFVDSGAELVFDADVAGPGTFTGTGEVTFNGSYAPGTSPGLGSFGGDVGFGDDASLLIELGGTNPDQHDRLATFAEMHLDGYLDVSLIGGFTPQVGNQFQIAKTEGLSGQFNGLAHGDSLGAFGSVHLQIGYEVGNLFLTAIPALLPGDANGDGVVDVDDLGILATYYGNSNAGWSTGDFNGDGVVDVSDLGILATYYGNTAAQTVPEPGTLTLLVTCWLTLLGLGSRRRR